MANPMRRKLKNVINQYTDAQVKVREATSNDPWGPSSTLMSEVADLSYNVVAFGEVMQMIWKRLNDSGKNWRHVYKALVLLEYILKTGSEKVAQQCRENIYAIQTLRDFQHIEDNKDQGVNVREKAKQLVTLLKDEERLKQERAKALKAKERFAQSSTGISSTGGMQQSTSMTFTRQHAGGSAPSLSGAGGYSDPYGGATDEPEGRRLSASDLEQARPSTVGEEELQLQLALAISKEEADQDTQDGESLEKKRGDDVRLAMALQESQKPKSGDETLVDILAEPRPPARTSNNNDQFWSTGGATAASGQSQNDPWTAPPSSGTDAFSVQSASNDPWAQASSAHPWTNNQIGSSATSPVVQNDPWAPVAASGSSPWGSQTPVGGASNHVRHEDDEFDVLMTRMTASPPNVMAADGDLSGAFQSNGAHPEKSKSPQGFLGANSGLVNLDDLVTKTQKGETRGETRGLARDEGPVLLTGAQGTNPFAAGETNSNPFLVLQAQQTRPTLNQMQYQTRTDYVQPNSHSLQNNLDQQPRILQPMEPSQNPFI